MVGLSDRPAENTLRLHSSLLEPRRTFSEKELSRWAPPNAIYIYVYLEIDCELRVTEGTHLCYLGLLSKILRQIEY